MRDGEKTIVRRKENFKGKESKKRENWELESLNQDLGESENDPFSQQTPLHPKVNDQRERKNTIMMQGRWKSRKEWHGSHHF